MQTRIIGFDLARAYAIFGMFIVNFNTVFGSHTDTTGLSGFLNLFNGNSSALFVILAGMGVSLMSARATSEEDKKNIRKIISKRAWFLFTLGVLFYNWWPADILHFYGGYMHMALLFLFIPRGYYLWIAFACIVIFHLLLFIIPFETGWDFSTFLYKDFWTVSGFLRNTFYNGWNPIFPWMAYFILGMYLGKLNLLQFHIRRNLVLLAGLLYCAVVTAQYNASKLHLDKDLLFYLNADYLPPFLPFMISTASFGVIVICLFCYLGEKFKSSGVLQLLANTGQHTLTHYLSHLIIGFTLFSIITGKQLGFDIIAQTPTEPWRILSFAASYYLISAAFSYHWKKRFRFGPVETLMRKISG